MRLPPTTPTEDELAYQVEKLEEENYAHVQEINRLQNRLDYESSELKELAQMYEDRQKEITRLNAKLFVKNQLITQFVLKDLKHGK